MNGREYAYSVAKQHGADGALFEDGINRRYVTGFPSSDGLALCLENEAVLILDMRYALAAEGKNLEGVCVVRSTDGLYKTLKEQVAARGIKSLIIESTAVTVAALKRLEEALEGVKLIPVADINGKARQIKTAFEIDCVKKAQAITDKCFAHILGYIKRGMTEKEIAAEMEYFMKKNGADGLAFETIAVSGVKSALPHGVPGNEVLTENGFFTMDFGASYNGYCSDMTRTIVLGKASDKMRHIYETVLEGQKRAIAAIKSGAHCKAVDKAARDYIYAEGYEGCFGHSTGHSLGLEIHELPSCSTRSEDVLQSGMFMTVEPGIYIEGLGGVRIEDTVLVTDTGCENIAVSPKHLIEL